MTKLAALLPIEDFLYEELDNYALPEVCNRVRTLIDNKAASIYEIANVIFVEPVIVTRLLQITNSPMFNLKTKVTTLSQALVVLGVETAYRLLVTQFTSSLFKKLHNESIDMRRFWQQSFASAVACYELATAFNLPRKDRETLYIMGLLHNIGELLVAKKAPALAILTNDQMVSPNHPFVVQKAQCGFAYPELTALALRKWSMPEEVCLAIKRLPNNTVYESMSLKERIFNIGVYCGICTSMESYYTIENFFSAEKSLFSTPELSFDQLISTMRKASDMSSSAINTMDAINVSNL